MSRTEPGRLAARGSLERVTSGRVLALGLLVWACGGAHGLGADEPYRPPFEQQADTVLSAFEAHDAASLRGLATDGSAEVWRVADALLARGRADAAEAYAALAPRPEFEPLAAYLSAQRTRHEDADRRAALYRAYAAHEKQDAAGVLRELQSVSLEPEDVVSVSAVTLQTLALEQEKDTRAQLDALQALAGRVERLGWHRPAIRAHFQIATQRAAERRFEEAAAEYERSIQAADRTVRPDLQLSTRVALAGQWFMAGTPERGRTRAEEALSRAREVHHHQFTAVMTAVLAAGAERTGDLAGALALLEDAIREFHVTADDAAVTPSEALEARRTAAATEGEVVRLLITLGRYTDALPRARAALARLDELHMPAEAGAVRLLLGVILVVLGRSEEGEPLVAGAGGAFPALGAGPLAALLTAALADIAGRRYTQAEARLARLLPFARLQLPPQQASVVALWLAILEVERGALPEAESHLDLVAKLGGEPVGWDFGRLMGGVFRGVLHVKQGKLEGLGEAREALEALRPFGGYPFLGAFYAVAESYALAGQPAAVRDLAREGSGLLLQATGGLGQEATLAIGSRAADYFQLGLGAALALNDVPGAAWFLEGGRARALRDALGVREAVWRVALPEDLRQADTRAHEVEAQASARHREARADRDPEETRRRRDALAAARKEVQSVIARIQEQAQRAAGVVYPRVPELGELEAALRPDEALVLYAWPRPQPRALEPTEALALVVEPHGARLVHLGAPALLDEPALAALRQPTRPAGRVLEDLGAALVAPLQLGPQTRRVLVSPDGPLHALPLALLFGEREAALMPSGAVLLELAPERALRGDGVLALGDPTFDGPAAEPGSQRGRLARLPGTRAEAQAVGDVLLLGAEAGERRLRETLPTRPRWRAVHLATHGLIDLARPLESGLALSSEPGEDGRLTVAEVFGLRVPADLVVLSACETAQGPVVAGEGVNGLARAFLMAGATRVLVSLWRVDDEATRELMQRFYAAWKQGLTPAAALRRAQAEVRAQERWKHPYFWAAWTLWGLPD